MCWRFYVEPSFYLKTLLNSEGFQKVSREFYLNYYIKQNSYLQIEQGFFKQKIEWKALPADQRLNQEQQELALEQGKARLRNFLTTLKSLAGLGFVVGHSIVFSIFGKVISGATYGVKNVWLTQLSRLGFFQRRPMLNSFISSELTWYGMGGVIVASYLFMIKTEKDFEQHVLESEQIVLDPDIHRFSKKMIYLRGIKMAYDDFMIFKSYQNKETLTQSEENEFLKLEKKVDHDFQRYSTKLDFLKALSKEMEESSENIYSNNDRGMQRLLAEYIDLVEQYIRIIN